MKEQQERRRTVFQRMYNSEVIAVSCFYDGGFNVKLGDSLNGFKAEEEGVATWDDVCDCSKAAARIHYPNSHFARAGEEICRGAEEGGCRNAGGDRRER